MTSAHRPRTAPAGRAANLPPALADNRLVRRFADLRREGQKAFIPFIAAGYPNAATTVELTLAMERAGASIVELGVPFSDPVADGPTIQTAFTRALDGGFEVRQVFEIVEAIRKRSDMPVVLMLSCSIVHRIGTERFVARAARAGVDGLIVPDLPPEDAGELRQSAAAHGVALIFLVTPATRPERVRTIVNASTGFIYYVSVMGTTGARTALPKVLARAVREVKATTDRPVCIGFGISRPEHVRSLGGIADGIIVGSALVALITQAIDTGKSPIEPVANAVKELAAALPNTI